MSSVVYCDKFPNSPNGYLAVIDGDKAYSFSREGRNDHSETLTNYLETFLDKHSIKVEDIKEVIREEYRIIFEQQTSLPAVNIGHLATKLPYQCRGIGSFVVNYVLSMLLSHKATGVQFITVDSLNNPKTNKFYMNNGFLYQTNEDIMAETRRMFLSLIEYIE